MTKKQFQNCVDAQKEMEKIQDFLHSVKSDDSVKIIFFSKEDEKDYLFYPLNTNEKNSVHLQLINKIHQDFNHSVRQKMQEYAGLFEQAINEFLDETDE